MRKLGIGIFAVTFCFTAFFGLPKMRTVAHLKTDCIELRKSASENQSELDNVKEQIESEKEEINGLRNAENSPYDLQEVSNSIKGIKGIKIKSVDAYNSSSDGGNVLVKTIKGSKDLAKLNSDVNLLDYKLSADNIDEAVNGINALKLNVTSFSIDKAKKTIDLSVKFIGGEEE